MIYMCTTGPRLKALHIHHISIMQLRNNGVGPSCRQIPVNALTPLRHEETSGSKIKRPSVRENRPQSRLMNIRHRLYMCWILLVAVVTSGSVGFHFIEHWSWFDAFYMTLTTMTTIGYGEIHPLSHTGRIFNSFMIVFAVFSGGFTIATFSQALLQFEFGKAFGRRRMERELAKLSDHYIICGAGRVGRTVARELRARGQTVVFIEKNPQRAEWAASEKIPVVLGNASSEECLKRAHVDTA